MTANASGSTRYDEATSFFDLGCAKEHSGNIYDALQEYKKALKLCLKFGKAADKVNYISVSFLRHQTGREEKVLLKFDPKFCVLYFDTLLKVSKMFAMLGCVCKAKTYCTEMCNVLKMSKLLSVFQSCTLWKSELCLMEGDVESAEKHLNSILELRKEAGHDFHTYTMRGRILHAKGDFIQAELNFEKSMRCPNNSVIQNSIAKLNLSKNYMKVENFDVASTLLREVLEADCSGCVVLGEAHYHLAFLLRKSDDRRAMDHILTADRLVKGTGIPHLIRDIMRLKAEILLNQPQLASSWEVAESVLQSIGTTHNNLAKINEKAFFFEETTENSFRELIETRLTRNWTVVGMAISPTGNLLLSRVNGSELPITECIELGKEEYALLLRRWTEIMQKNKKSLKFSSENRTFTIAEKVRWWEERDEIDKSIEEFLASLQRNFLKKREATQFLRGYKQLNDIGGEANSVAQITCPHGEIEKCRKDEITKNGRRPKKSAGSKGLRYLSKSIQTTLFAENVGCLKDAAGKVPSIYEPIILLLDEGLQTFPFESMPCMEEQSTSRLPSFSYIFSLQSDVKKSSDGVYVLDPEANLPNTQVRLAPVLQAMEGWKGFVGHLPDEESVIQALSSSGFFVFCGHGAGERIINRDVVSKLIVSAFSILMGCSSGRLKGVGLFEPVGMVSAYLVAGCPSVVGNLWDVTDKDIDRFSISLLKMIEAAKPGDRKTMANFISDARLSCKLKFITGHSPVCYGLPLPVSQ